MLYRLGARAGRGRRRRRRRRRALRALLRPVKRRRRGGPVLVLQAGPKWAARGVAADGAARRRRRARARTGCASSRRRPRPATVRAALGIAPETFAATPRLDRGARRGGRGRHGRHRRGARRRDARRRRSSTSFPTAFRRAGPPLAAVGRAVPRAARLGGRRRCGRALVEAALDGCLLSARCWSRPAAGSATRCWPASSRARCARGTPRSTPSCCPRTSTLAAHIPAIERVVPLGAPLAARYAAAVVTWATLRTALAPLARADPGPRRPGAPAYSLLFTASRRRPQRAGRSHARTGPRSCSTTRARSAATSPTRRRISAVRDDERRDAATLLRVHDAAGPFYLLHPTRGLSAQRARWPIDGFVALARRLVARDGVPVLVTGASDDAPLAQAIADAGRARGRLDRGRDVDRRRSGRVAARRAGGRRDGFGTDARRGGGRRADGRDLCAAVRRAGPLGAAGPRARPSCGRATRARPGTARRRVPTSPASASSTTTRILAALDGLLVATAER